MRLAAQDKNRLNRGRRYPPDFPVDAQIVERKASRQSGNGNACPTCGRPYPAFLMVSGLLRQRLIEALHDSGDGLSCRDLVNRVYADDPNGGPINANRCVNLMVHKANKELEPQGYRIKYGFTKYRLVKL